MLGDIGFELVEFSYVDDEDNKTKWESLAASMEQSAQAIRAVAVHGHKPAMESWSEEATP